MPACRSPIGSICRVSGLTIRPVAKRRVSQRRSGSRKPQIALEQIRAALLASVPPGVVLTDSSYGNNSKLRQDLTGLGLSYVAAIQSATKVRLVREDDPKPRRVSVEELALSLPKCAWRTVAWREGTNVKLRSRFARVRVHAAPSPAKHVLKKRRCSSSGQGRGLDPDMSLRCLVDLAKMRWRVERDYEDLKQEIGLRHYEGRGWPGFHHHGTLAIAAYGFPISERGTIPPSGPHSAAPIKKSPLPSGYRPRGAADPAAAPPPNSIATIRPELTAAIANRLPTLIEFAPLAVRFC
jgi:SRSO17 transposase